MYHKTNEVVLVPLPVLAKKRSIGLPKPTTSRVASEATCVQRKDVSPLYTFALPFESIPPVALPEPAPQGTMEGPTLPHAATRGAARKSPGCSGAGDGGC